MPPTSHSKRVALLLFCASLCYLPSLTFPLLQGWDDPTYILDNTDRLAPSLVNVRRFLEAPYFNNYHPVTMLSYMVDFSLGRTHGSIYRIQNLFWHLVACAGLYACFCRFGVEPHLSWFLALVWAVHPQRVESVVWVSERKDVLCGAFVLWALWRYTRRPARPVLAFLLFLLAILSKAMAITFVGVLACVEWVEHDGRIDRRALKRLFPYAVVTMIMILVAVRAQGESLRTHVPLIRRLGVAAWNIGWYAWRTVFPANLCPMYPRIDRDPGTILAAALALVLLCCVAALWQLRGSLSRRDLFIRVGPALLLYPMVLAPVSGLLPLAFIDRADRYSYLPSAVLLWLVGRLGQDLRTSGRVRQILSHITAQKAALGIKLAAAAIAGALMWQTYLYTRVWHSYTSILYAAYMVEQPHPKVIGGLAEALLEAKEGAAVRRLADELASCDRPYLSALQREAHVMKATFLRAAVLEMEGELSQAAVCLHSIDERVCEGDTSTFLDAQRYYHLKADIEMRLEEFEQAITSYTELLSRYPSDARAYLGRGCANLRAGRAAAALADLLQAQSLDPYSPQVEARMREARSLIKSPRQFPAAGD